MDVQAIALPHGTALTWIRVGALLDAMFARGSDEVVQGISRIPSGFRVETKDSATNTIRYYQAPGYVVSRVESSSGDPASGYAESTEKSLIVRPNLAFGV